MKKYSNILSAFEHRILVLMKALLDFSLLKLESLSWLHKISCLILASSKLDKKMLLLADFTIIQSKEVYQMVFDDKILKSDAWIIDEFL